MNKEIRKTHNLTNFLFPKISDYCKNCNTCCKTYGWLIDKEVNKFLNKGYPVIQINKKLYCFDSFARDENKEIIINKIPRCLFYKKNRCLINDIKPLDCRLYPIKIKFYQNKVIIGLSLGCKYVSSLSDKEIDSLCLRIMDFLKEAPPKIINDYLNLMESVNSISESKNFKIKNIIEIKKYKGRWKMLE